MDSYACLIVALSINTLTSIYVYHAAAVLLLYHALLSMPLSPWVLIFGYMDAMHV